MSNIGIYLNKNFQRLVFIEPKELITEEVIKRFSKQGIYIKNDDTYYTDEISIKSPCCNTDLSVEYLKENINEIGVPICNKCHTKFEMYIENQENLSIKFKNLSTGDISEFDIKCIDCGGSINIKDIKNPCCNKCGTRYKLKFDFNNLVLKMHREK